MGFQGGQGPNLLFYEARLFRPDDYFRAFFSPRPCYIFTISFRCQTFQLTNPVQGNNESVDSAFFARSRSFSLKRTETDPKVVFSSPRPGRFLCHYCSTRSRTNDLTCFNYRPVRCTRRRKLEIKKKKDCSVKRVNFFQPTPFATCYVYR